MSKSTTLKARKMLETGAVMAWKIQKYEKNCKKGKNNGEFCGENPQANFDAFVERFLLTAVKLVVSCKKVKRNRFRKKSKN